MKIVARTQIGREFVYSTASAHSVSERSAETICNILNEYKYRLNDGECWFIYDIDHMDLWFSEDWAYPFNSSEFDRAMFDYETHQL